ncbi:peroxisomal acyl-coenzyme A oxidase 1-like [Ptychodera flava]|uniref:peroxisomal acyl-coenzyme A oxidase 1-like n=1 Tax=Ptychodera flava TaxID=63121 RepID=UPI00396A65A1
MNPDLQREREKATFESIDLTYVTDGGREKTRRRRYIESLVLNDPAFKHEDFSFLTRNEQINLGAKLSILLEKKIKQYNLHDEDDLKYFRGAFPHHAFLVHHLMFKPSILGQGTEEQQKKWLPLADNLKIIGTYAQTELGHGTFLRGLETTATFDPKTDEFVMHSPTLTSMKWWPGHLGRISSHAIVVAQLYTKGECHGIHQFMVPLRSMKDHTPLPGVTLGDIGPKLDGFLDNGFLKLDHVRIPRENMMMKFAQVTRDGSYIKPVNSRMTYASMVLMRVAFTEGAAKVLSQACMISVRYSAVRHQTEMTPGGGEPQILDYQSQQYKLFPIVAATYAFYLAARNLKAIYTGAQDEFKVGNFESLADLHSISSGLKAFCADACNKGVETCRHACGGHGFLQASRLPYLYGLATALVIVEGENTVLYLQVARYLMKCVSQAMAGQKLPSLVSYMTEERQHQWSVKSQADLHDLSLLLDAYKHRCQRLVTMAAEKLQNQIMSGSAQHEAWNNTHLSLIKAAKAHCHLFVVRSFVDGIRTMDTSESARAVLKSLCQLYALSGIQEHSGDFLHDGYLSGDQVSMVSDFTASLLATIRPNAVAIVDAFDVPDAILGSVLGRYDGRVYEHLYESAKQSPVNKQEVHESYHKYYKPLLQSDRAKL